MADISTPRPHYILNLFICLDDPELLQLYSSAAEEFNVSVNRYLAGNNDFFYDSGFDIFCPKSVSVPSLNERPLGFKVPLGVKCSMSRVGSSLVNNNSTNSMSIKNDMPVRHVGYYLYSRSSTPLKTPLRLSNSVGIIDSGYTGEITALFDNLDKSPYIISKYQRLVQICPPDLSYPLKINITQIPFVTDFNSRGNNGLGSTGK
tara:strand:+ start:63 stop:674 length:612 start_codon:yes stop_codon:yes gene_type:complete